MQTTLTLAKSVHEHSCATKPGLFGTIFPLVFFDRLPDHVSRAVARHTTATGEEYILFIQSMHKDSLFHLVYPEIKRIGDTLLHEYYWTLLTSDQWHYLEDLPPGSKFEVEYELGDPKDFIVPEPITVSDIAAMIKVERKDDKKAYKRLAQKIYNLFN